MGNPFRPPMQSPEDFEIYKIGSETKTTRIGVIGSDKGAGRLDITKTTYRNGDYEILAKFYPNALSDEELKIGKHYSTGEGRPYHTGKDAAEAMAKAFNMKLKLGEKT